MGELWLGVSFGAILLVGITLGWVFARFGTSPDAKTSTYLRDRVETLETDLKAANHAAETARTELAKSLAEQQVLRDAHEDKLKNLIEAKDTLSAQFSEIGQKLFNDAQTQFLKRADERFAQQGEKSSERLQTVLEPIKEKLKSYEDQVTNLEKARAEAYGDLKALMTEMKAGQERVQTEAARLVNSLRNAPKARGTWGEQQLKNVLETCGLSEFTDFELEKSIMTEDGRLRPDATIRIPGGRSLVVDAKVSINDYQDAFEAEDDAGKTSALQRHATAMRNHIKKLSEKAYWDQFDEAPDYVVMFIGGEHFLSAALEYDPTLWDTAFEKRVLLATPTNLVAIARTIASVWRQESMAKEAKSIAALGKELYGRLAKAQDDIRKVGSGLTTAVSNYNSFVGTYESRVVSTAKKFEALNIDVGPTQLSENSDVETQTRQVRDDLFPSQDVKQISKE